MVSTDLAPRNGTGHAPGPAAPAPDWFDEWAEYHLRGFGLPMTDDFAATFNIWREVFRHLRYSSADLYAATASMIASPPPPARFGELLETHLRSIHAAVKENRRLAARATAGFGDEASTCGGCGDSGWVVVPHWRQVDAGSWLSAATQVVYCRCPVGRARLAEIEARLAEPAKPGERRRGRSLTLEEYEAKVLPDWRRVMTERDALAVKLCPSAPGPMADVADRLWRKYVRPGGEGA
jgi:hypothetical protein